MPAPEFLAANFVGLDFQSSMEAFISMIAAEASARGNPKEANAYRAVWPKVRCTIISVHECPTEHGRMVCMQGIMADLNGRVAAVWQRFHPDEWLDEKRRAETDGWRKFFNGGGGAAGGASGAASGADGVRGGLGGASGRGAYGYGA